METETPNLDLTPAQRAYVVSRAERQGVSPAEVLARLVPGEEGLAGQGGDERSAFDLATQLGLIGMSEEGPADLATNPQHMEGFGGDAQEPRPR